MGLPAHEFQQIDNKENIMAIVAVGMGGWIAVVIAGLVLGFSFLNFVARVIDEYSYEYPKDDD